MRNPLLHFVVLGALLFGAQRLWPQPAAPLVPTTIVVPAAPDAASVDAAIDDEVLFREALARELDRDDRMVRERLVRLGRFLGLAAQGGDDAVEREARSLGLHRSDPVVRRHLVEMMRLAAAEPRSVDPPSESTLLAYYQRHAERFVQPARTRLTHVYLSAERRGTRIARDAEALLDALRQRPRAPEDAAVLGDPFVRGAALMLTPTQLEDTFGPGFAAAVADLPERTWSQPVRSAYGLHLVWIDARVATAPAPFAAVRNRVLHEVLRERGEARLRDTLQALRAQYDVRVEAKAS